MDLQFGTCIEDLYQCKIDIMRALMRRMPLEKRALSSIVTRKIFRGNQCCGTGNKNLLMISAESVRSLKFESEHSVRVLCDENTAKKHLLSGGDIVFVLEGHDAGASAIIPVFSPGGVIDGSCAGISIDGTIADPFYVVNVLHYWYRTGLFSKIVDASGGISIKTLEALEIPLPDVEIQKHVSMAMLHISGLIEAMKNSQ